MLTKNENNMSPFNQHHFALFGWDDRKAIVRELKMMEW